MKANTFKKAVSYFALASVFTMTGCQKDELLENTSAASNDSAKQSLQAQNGSKVEGEYIVVMNDGVDAEQEIDALTSSEGISKADIHQRFNGAVKGFSGHLSQKQLELLKKNKNVKTIEQDQVITASQTTSSTTTVSTQTVNWGVARVGSGDGTGKTAWVIDSGVIPNHPDLNIDATRSRCFITGITSWVDGYGHGTAVAGIIGAKNNTVGTVGVAANATIVALRVFDNAGAGMTSSAIKAVNHVIANAKPGDVVNMSLGGGISATLDNAVKSAAAKGIFFAIASGNSAVDCANTSPARVNAPNVYTVSSMNSYGKFSSFSNFGLAVDIAGPGESITTTSKSGGYASGSGTSYAAPHIAGLLLLKGNTIRTNGFVTGDKDSKADPIDRKSVV